MIDNARPRGRLRIHEFEIDLDRGSLRKELSPVHLAPIPYRVLVHLALHADRLVTRQELRQEIWEGRHVEFDESLNFAIRSLRKALGDSATTPRFIETVPRRGYRLIAPVTVVEPAIADEPVAAWPRRFWRPLVLAAAAAAMALFAVSRVETGHTVRVRWEQVDAGRFGSDAGEALQQSLQQRAGGETDSPIACRASCEFVAQARLLPVADGSVDAVETHVELRRITDVAEEKVWEARVRSSVAELAQVGTDIARDVRSVLPQVLAVDMGAAVRTVVVEEGAPRAGAPR